MGADRRDPFSVSMNYDLEWPIEPADLQPCFDAVDDLDGRPYLLPIAACFMKNSDFTKTMCPCPDWPTGFRRC